MFAFALVVIFESQCEGFCYAGAAHRKMLSLQWQLTCKLKEKHQSVSEEFHFLITFYNFNQNQIEYVLLSAENRGNI